MSDFINSLAKIENCSGTLFADDTEALFLALMKSSDNSRQNYTKKQAESIISRFSQEQIINLAVRYGDDLNSLCVCAVQAISDMSVLEDFALDTTIGITLRKLSAERLTDSEQLKRIALDSDSSELTAVAIRRINDGESLFDIVLSEKVTPELKKIAVSRINDKDILLKIVKQCDDKSVQAHAVYKLDDDGLYQIAKSQSSLMIRALAATLIKKLEYQLEIANDGENDDRLRVAAISGITDIDILRPLVSQFEDLSYSTSHPDVLSDIRHELERQKKNIQNESDNDRRFEKFRNYVNFDKFSSLRNDGKLSFILSTPNVAKSNKPDYIDIKFIDYSFICDMALHDSYWKLRLCALNELSEAYCPSKYLDVIKNACDNENYYVSHTARVIYERIKI